VLTEPTQDLPAVYIGYHDIQNNDLWVIAGQTPKQARCAADALQPVAGAGDVAGEELCKVSIVVNKQNVHHARCGERQRHRQRRIPLTHLQATAGHADNSAGRLQAGGFIGHSGTQWPVACPGADHDRDLVALGLGSEVHAATGRSSDSIRCGADEGLS